MEQAVSAFWHACRRRDLDSIMAHGLAPVRSRSRSKAVYLAGDRYTAENYSNFEPEAEWVVLEVDGSLLDPALLAPDDYELPDLLAQMEDEEAQGLCVDPDAPADSLDWRQSLAVCCQVRYFGCVPPEALTAHALSSGHETGPRP